MRFTRWVLAGGIALAGISAAFAQGQTINDYVRDLVIDYGDGDEYLVGGVELNELEEDETVTVVFDLDPHKSYWVLAACDDDCSLLELDGRNAEGETIDSDDESEDKPMLLIGSGNSGDELHVEITMAGCEEVTCVVGLGLFEIPS